MTRSLRSVRHLALLAAVGLIATACSGGTSPSGSGASDASPSQGGTLSMSFNSDFQHLDPALAYDTVALPVMLMLYDRLLGYDDGTKLVPELAEAMPTVSDDGKSYTFKLRKGVNFVNADGSVLREITGDDVAHSINRVLDPGLKPNPSPVQSAFFGNIAGAAEVIAGRAETASGIKVIDPNTIQFDLVNADRTFLNVMATSFASIVPKELAGEDTAAFEAKPVGSGPFLLKSYTKGQSAQFVRNPGYWQPSLPHLDGVDLRLSLDENTALQQVQAGQLDVLGDAIPSGSFTQVTSDPNYEDQVYHHTLVNTQYLWMDTQQPGNGPLTNRDVREAIAHAIDKDHIIQIIHGTGVKAGCIFPPDLPGFDPSCDPYDYDPAKAKQMLAAAGFPNGFTTTLITDTTDPDPQVAEAIQQDLAQVGITADLQKQEFSTFLDTLFTPHTAPLGYVGWNQDYPDQSDFIDPLLVCAATAKGGANSAQYCNPEVDSAAAAAKGMTDEAARTAAYQDIQKTIMADVPWVPIYNLDRYHITSERVGGFAIHPVWIVDPRGMWLESDS
jgi:ABC-type transport system substrate-binding protein